MADNAVIEKPDPRLDKKVTLEVSHAKLEDVVKQLSDQTGIVIKAGNGKRDWRVRERRVTIQAKDIRLGDLMDRISKLLNYYLSRGGKDGEWTYLYWQDMRSRALEEEMLIAAREAAAQRTVKARQGALDMAEDALAMTSEEALKKRDKDPLLAYMGGTKAGRGFAQLLSALGTGYSTERDLMLRGRRVNMPLTGFSPALQQAVADATSGGFFAPHLTGENFQGLVPGQVIFEPADSMGNSEMGALGFGGLVFITSVPIGGAPGDGPFGGGMPMSMFPLSSPNSPIGKLAGKFFLAIEEGKSLEEASKQIQSEMESTDFMADALARESKTEKNPPTDPKLTREVELGKIPAGSDPEGSANDLSKAAAEISKATGNPVLMESFTKMMAVGRYLKPGKQPFYKILIGLEKAGYTWERSGDTLRIRPEDWALRRSYEISERWLGYYKTLLEKNGGFTLDEIAAMALELTDDQITNTMLSDTDLRFAVIPLGDNMSKNKNILRLYATLTAQQKAMLESEFGLAFAYLKPAQWDYLNEVITDRLGGVYIVNGSIRLKPQSGEKKPGDSSTNKFDIMVNAANEARPRTITVRIMIFGKNQIAEMNKSVQKAQETTNKAPQQEEQPNPAPASPPK